MKALTTRRQLMEETGFKRMETSVPNCSILSGTGSSVVGKSIFRTRDGGLLVLRANSDIVPLVMNEILSEVQRLESERYFAWSRNPFTAMLGEGVPEGAKRCASRLLYLLRLSNDWYDEESRAPTALSLSAATAILRLVPALVPFVSIFPMYSGGVMFEYEHDQWDWSVEIHANGEVEIHGSASHSDEEFPLQQFACMEDALETISQHVPKG